MTEWVPVNKSQVKKYKISKTKIVSAKIIYKEGGIKHVMYTPRIEKLLL